MSPRRPPARQAGPPRKDGPAARHPRQALSRSGAASRPSRPEKSRPRGGRGRFETRRTVVVPGSKGPRHFSLRILAVAFFVLVAIIGIAPTLSNYVQKQQELAQLRVELQSVKDHTEELQRELELWNDDEYVKTQARERLGFVMPGQQLYVVTDPKEGTAAEQLEQRVKSVNRSRRAVTPWYSTMWDSISVAGQTGELDNPNDAPIIEDKKTND